MTWFWQLLTMNAILTFILLLFTLPVDAASRPVLEFNQAQRVIGDSDAPPEFVNSDEVILPDVWRHDRNGFYGSTWYRIVFRIDEPADERWAVYLSRVNMNAEVWLNGARLGAGGSMQKPVSRHWHAPLMFVFSPADLKQENSLVIRVVAYANEYGRLGKVSIGPGSVIDAVYSKNYFSKVTIHIISGALAGVYAFFMMLVWWRRNDAVFFWGALVCAAWSISSMNLYIVDPPVSELVWEKMMQFTVGWIPLLFFFFIIRLDRLRKHPRIETVIIVMAGLINLALVVTPANGLFAISRIWHIYSLFFGIVGVIRVLYSWLRYRRQTQFAMLVAFGLIAVCGLHDFMVQNQILGTDEIFWLDYSVPIVLLLIGYLMVSRFLIAVDMSEKLNRELEDRVQQAQHKIEADYEKILVLETEQASNKERERIYRDMHDDMGAKLLSMVYRAESEEMSSLARSAMNDLRAIVSKKPGGKHLLVDVIAKWQQVSKKRCDDAGFAFHWYQTEIPETITLSAESYQNLLRIQSEALTNVIKHSYGKAIRISVRYRSNCLSTVVADDGDYSHMNHWLEGRGISSMRYRVSRLYGKIRWQAKPGDGGLVSWIIPLEKNRAL